MRYRDVNDIETIKLNIKAHVDLYKQANNLTFGDIAQRIGIAKSTAHNLIYGKLGSCRLTSLVKIANALDMTVAELIQGANNGTRDN